MLRKIFESIYLKIFVNVIVKKASIEVYIESCSKKDVCQRNSKIFDTHKIDNSVIEYVKEFTKESPYSYISVLDYSSSQGAIPTCDKNTALTYHDLSITEYKCYDDKWMFYTSKSDLYQIEKDFSKLGLDFVFSPFSILSNFFKDKIDSYIALYAIIQDSYVSICVFEHGELKYADHLDLQHEEDSPDDMLLIDDSDDVDLDFGNDDIDLEDVDVIDEMEVLDDFGNIEELDSLEEIDEFSEHKDIEEELLEADEVIAESDDEGFNEDYQRFYLIQSSLGHFYNDKRYKSDFIENIYIADGIGVSKDLKRYLEDEMFLNVYIRHVDLPIEVCELAKLELDV